MSARIAAIITCRDLGRTLLEALESVERQIQPAAEVIVIDDGSAELYTKQLLGCLQEQGTRVAQAGGRGASAARNLGARLTSAEYLVWLDADDVLEPSYLAAAAALLDADADLDFVSCAIRAFGEATYTWRPAAPTLVEMISNGAWPHASTMIRRRLWETVGGFDETLPLFELLDFWASAFTRGFKGVVIDEPLLNYRVRAGSRYQRMIQPATYVSQLARFYGKHRAAIDRHGLDSIKGKEAFYLSQRRYHEELETRARSLELELGRLQAEISETTRQLEQRGGRRIEWGDLQIQPHSRQWGRDRGTPVDRHYIERFLERHRADIRGRVLEVRQPMYVDRFGGDAVTARDVIDIEPANNAATLVADLRQAERIPAATYDCIILTQTLHLIDDMPAVLAECERILRCGGVLLATAPSVSKVDEESGLDGDFWRLTEASARMLCAGAFPVSAFEITPFGNVKACTAFLYGLSAEELLPADLEYVDARFPLVIGIRAVKPHTVNGATAARRPLSPTLANGQGSGHVGVILAYHRVAELTPDSHALCTPPAAFREQMMHLSREFSPIGLEDLVRSAASGRIPERAVAVTLDDGYLDALTVAAPILSDLGVPATFFVNTDRLSEEHERWWDTLERLFLSEAILPPVLELEIAGQEMQLPTVTKDQRSRALEVLNRSAWPLDVAGRADMVDHVMAWSGAHLSPRASHRVLTDHEVCALADGAGHSIGAHTSHHLALTTQPPETKQREVLGNKVALERLLLRPVRLFSYPYGDYDSETVTIVREAGFMAGVTVHPGVVTAGTNRLLIPRFEITPNDNARFPLRMREIFEGLQV